MATRDTAYDILIAGKGYVLARSRQLGTGGRAWSVRSAGAGTARLTPTETTYGNQPSVVEAPMVWRTTHLGYGAERQDIEGRYNYSVNVDARFPEQVIPGPLITGIATAMGANVVGFFEQGGLLFVIGGRYCRQIAADNSVVAAQDFGAGETATDVLLFNENAYIGMGYTEPFWERVPNANPALGWTQAVLLYMGYMSLLGSRLWASVTNHEVQCVAADPMTAIDWGSIHAIGDPGEDITSLAELAELLYVGKTEGLYALDSSAIGEMLTPEFRPYGGVDNCRKMGAWHGSMWVPHIRGLLNYQNLGEQGFLVIPATPGYDSGPDNPVRGIITAMAGDNRWLYAALYTVSGDTYLMAGREAAGEETRIARLIWHPLAHMPGIRCDAMHISGLWTNPRLFFGRDDDVGYIILPRFTDNPLHDQNCRFNTSGSIYYPAHTWHVPTTRKVWSSTEAEADNLLVGRYLEVYYRIDRSGVWTSLGQMNVSPYHILTFPEDTIGKEIELRVDHYLPLTDTPTVLRTLLARGAERPRGVSLITAAILCADDLTLRTGARCNRTGATMLAELRALARQTEAVGLTDLTGMRRTVLVLDPVEEQEAEQEGERPQEVIAIVHMATFEAQATAEDWLFWIWDESLWDGGHVWGP